MENVWVNIWVGTSKLTWVMDMVERTKPPSFDGTTEIRN